MMNCDYKFDLNTHICEPLFFSLKDFFRKNPMTSWRDVSLPVFSTRMTSFFFLFFIIIVWDCPQLSPESSFLRKKRVVLAGDALSPKAGRKFLYIFVVIVLWRRQGEMKKKATPPALTGGHTKPALFVWTNRNEGTDVAWSFGSMYTHTPSRVGRCFREKMSSCSASPFRRESF